MCLIIELYTLRGWIGTAAAFWTSRTTAKCPAVSTNIEQQTDESQIDKFQRIKKRNKITFSTGTSWYWFHHEASDDVVGDDDDATVGLESGSSLHFPAAF